MNNLYDYLINEEIFFKKFKDTTEEIKLIINDIPSIYEPSHNDDTWIYYHCKKNNLPNQGWKIHISAHLTEIEKVLNIVSKEAFRHDLSFKHLKSKNTYLSSNSKNANRASSGKFITIYPENEKKFLKIINSLESALINLKSGPYILNDKRWKSTNIFYRYGAFVKMVNDKGEHCILDPKGNLIIDRREPFYSVPDFANDFDKYLNSKNIQEEDVKTKLDNYDIKEALSFSNSGGVYKAIRKLDQKKVLIKEARPNTGFDGQQRTAFERLDIEYDALLKLKNVRGIVNIIERFPAWEHRFIVEEFIEGDTLHSWISKNYSFLSFEDDKEYIKKTDKIARQLIKIVTEMHKKSVVMGDLQPNNILINDKEEVFLIDFETASSLTDEPLVGLAVPTFSDFDIKTNKERDWYALKKIFDFMLLPIQTTKETGKYLGYIHQKWIEEHYDENVLGLQKTLQKKISIANNTQCTKNKEVDINKSILMKLQLGIQKNIKSNQYLTFNDIRQYDGEMGYIDILSGSCGVLWSLNQTLDKNKLNIYKKWIEKNLINQNFNSFNKMGLFDGLAGIATVLYEFDYIEESLSIFNKVATSSISDISLESGLSGIGLSLLSLYDDIKEDKYLKNCEDIAQNIINLYNEEKSNKDKGLMQGLSGVSLYFSLLYKITKNNEYLNYSKVFLEKDLENLMEVSETLQVLDNSSGNPRFLPYLSEGSIGIAIAIKFFQKVSNDNSIFSDYIQKILNLSNIKSTIDGGLFHGAAGFLLLPCMISDDKSEKIIVEKKVMNLLKLFLAKKEDYLLFPGDLNYRFCFDYYTGSAGVLSAIDCLINDNLYSWIPCINNGKIFK